MDWRDHPDKSEQWYQIASVLHEQRPVHKFAQEVDRNYAASVEGVIIPFEWIISAIDADKKLGIVMDDGGHQGRARCRGWWHGERQERDGQA
jgi:hypothetical protein